MSTFVIPKEMLTDALKLSSKSATSIEDVIKVLKKYGVEVRRVSSNLYRIIEDEERRAGGEYLYPSLFAEYFFCAKKMWLRKKYGSVATEETLRSIARGLVAHEKYTDFIRETFGGRVEAEPLLVSEEMKLLGKPDIIIVDGDIHYLLEFKSSPVVSMGAKLQAQMYALLYLKARGIIPRTYVVSLNEVRRVHFNMDYALMYLNRCRKVLSLDYPPPPTPRVANCEKCPYRALCGSNKSKYNSWDEYLVLALNEYPISEEVCKDCPFLLSCRAFRARHGYRPCMVKQEKLL